MRYYYAKQNVLQTGHLYSEWRLLSLKMISNKICIRGDANVLFYKRTKRRREKMRLTWLNNKFICKALYAPFKIGKDSDYINDLKNKYDIVMNQAKNSGADDESLRIIADFSTRILKSLELYYKADIAESNNIILELVKDIGNNPFAVNSVINSDAFPGVKSNELQFFRSRLGSPNKAFKAKDMIHLPNSMRAKSGNYRFSIPGNPSMYLANSSYGCWIETGCPAEIDFNVSPVLLEGNQKILNLAVSLRDFRCLNEFEEERVHCWLKLYLLTIATSYVVKEENRIFKSEYIISQSLMMACKKMGYDGIAYYSRRVDDEVFALCAINLALFVDYNGEYSEMIKHMKVDDAFNYSLYKQLDPSLKYKRYELRSTYTGYVTNIGSYDRQYPYNETDFYHFDEFLFTTWRDKPNGKGKDEIPWGVEI